MKSDEIRFLLGALKNVGFESTRDKLCKVVPKGEAMVKVSWHKWASARPRRALHHQVQQQCTQKVRQQQPRTQQQLFPERVCSIAPHQWETL